MTITQGYYAGIGSRSTPVEVLERMRRLSLVLADYGYILRSGGADGADTAFAWLLTPEQRQLFLPWRGFNSIAPSMATPWDESVCSTIAAAHHPAWEQCSAGARKLHARNVAQVLGPQPGVSPPSQFVVCWAEGSQLDVNGHVASVAGGTGQAVRIAHHHGILVFNLALPGHDRLLWEYIKATNHQPSVPDTARSPSEAL